MLAFFFVRVNQAILACSNLQCLTNYIARNIILPNTNAAKEYVREILAAAGVFLSAYAGRNSFLGGSRVFMYFTIQSNIAVALISLIGCCLMLTKKLPVLFPELGKSCRSIRVYQGNAIYGNRLVDIGIAYLLNYCGLLLSYDN